ncbi:metallophosphoesterase [Salipiger marinus]|uniref:metallophosphoesterase n=1 Tax=Salipiger marinus TaxID=555512 RepID=UPI0040595DEF
MLFLHLSDIHFRSKEVSRDDDPNGALRNDIVDDVRKMRAKIGRPADAVLISGDIAFAGAQDEYEFATAWLRDFLCPAAGCGMDDIFVIPGNHDVDRGQAASRMHKDARTTLRNLDGDAADSTLREYLSDPTSSQLIFAPLENYNEFAAQFECAIGPYDDQHPELKPFVNRSWTLNDGSTLKVWGFSSVLVSDQFDAVDRMFVDPMGTQIQRESGVVHAVMCHHPYNWLRNGGTFKARLEAVTHLQLFGHEHTRRIEEGRWFTTIRAGAIQPERDDPNWDPGYNWIEVSVETKPDDERWLNVSIWVRKWEGHRFIGVPDRDDNEQWSVPHQLAQWAEPATVPVATARAIADERAPAMSNDNGNSAGTPDEPLRSTTVVRKLLELSEHDQRRIIGELRLDQDGDQGLKRWQFVLAAVSRANEKGLLKVLNEEVSKLIAKKE